MSSRSEHINHPNHLLTIKENDVFEENAVYYGCHKIVVGSPTYTSSNCEDIDWLSTFLPAQELCILAHTNRSPYARLTFSYCPITMWLWIQCLWSRVEVVHLYMWWLSILCVYFLLSNRECFVMKVTRSTCEHDAKGKNLFKCNACGLKAKDSLYVCIAYDFWIHKKCALSPITIEAPAYRHRPLNLVYCIPNMHGYYHRFCNIFQKLVQKYYWVYCCHKCT